MRNYEGVMVEARLPILNKPQKWSPLQTRAWEARQREMFLNIGTYTLDLTGIAKLKNFIDRIVCPATGLLTASETEELNQMLKCLSEKGEK